jgi:putative NADH-flavin reductase
MTRNDVVILSVHGVIGDVATPGSAPQFNAAEMLVNVLFPMADSEPRLIHVGGSGSLEVEPSILHAAKVPKILLPRNLEAEILR